MQFIAICAYKYGMWAMNEDAVRLTKTSQMHSRKMRTRAGHPKQCRSTCLLALALAACFWQSQAQKSSWHEHRRKNHDEQRSPFRWRPLIFRTACPPLYHVRRCFQHGKELHSMEHTKSSAKLLGKTRHDEILWEDSRACSGASCRCG